MGWRATVFDVGVRSGVSECVRSENFDPASRWAMFADLLGATMSHEGRTVTWRRRDSRSTLNKSGDATDHVPVSLLCHTKKLFSHQTVIPTLLPR